MYVGDFEHMAVIVMDGNRLIMLPRIIISAKKLERLSLAYNKFTVLPDLSVSLLSLGMINLKGNCIVCGNNAIWLWKTKGTLGLCNIHGPHQNKSVRQYLLWLWELSPSARITTDQDLNMFNGKYTTQCTNRSDVPNRDHFINSFTAMSDLSRSKYH